MRESGFRCPYSRRLSPKILKAKVVQRRNTVRQSDIHLRTSIESRWTERVVRGIDD